MSSTSRGLARPASPCRPAGAIAIVLIVASTGGCGDWREGVPARGATTSVGQSSQLGASVTKGGHREQTAWDVVRGLEHAGFAVPNPLETTAQECPAVGCAQSVVTDTLRVESFETPSQAMRYGSARDLHQVGTIVVSFGPPLSSADRRRYWTEILRLAG